MLFLIFVGTSIICNCFAAIVIPPDANWALLAWGGGKDSVTSATSVVDIDMFDQASMIPSLKAQGKKVICYISAGTWESWRPDASDPNWQYIKLGQMNDWDEAWLDIRNMTALKIVMGNRMDQAFAQGCDGIEPDNTDCYQNRDCWGTMKNPSVSTGNSVKAAQITYNKWLSSYSHSKNMVIGLKNTIGLVNDLVSSFDFVINESCQVYDECAAYAPFSTAKKAIFNVEYQSGSSICSVSKTNHMQTKYCKSSDGNLCSSSWVNCF